MIQLENILFQIWRHQVSILPLSCRHILTSPLAQYLRGGHFDNTLEILGGALTSPIV